ncbi:MAG TPA: GAF domain-containing SpoIIE family protein phosphatase [Candidatus Acidoferrales bacterium]|jgi:sigma-B regulation protein RsbU (phosphoserine phosphatase)|nr:GAF domain-containing SpoIIE family protein phosphatase [Candidatus Acidoferrales bacterium]
MDQSSPNPIPFSLLGDADPAAPALLVAQPEQAQTISLLYEISHELTSILDREELLRRIAERVKKLVNYHVFTVMLWNESTQMLESVFSQRYEDALPSRFQMPLHQGITGTAAAERRTIRVVDVRLDPRYVSCGEEVEVRSELVVPLLLHDRLVGVLDLESTMPQAFSAEHERLLNILGSYIAVALENSRLFEDARENQTRMMNDLETAREIQRQLLPSGAKEIPGLDLATAYVPARELGGDFYDLLPYGVGRLAIANGDVSGKGTAAALYGSLAIGILRELVHDNEVSPAEMLEQLNGRLLAARLDARFIAMQFAVYDAALRELTIANAGGTLPLLIRNREVTEINVAGMPLGLLPEAEYEQVTLSLSTGDVVVFASDGIHESMNKEQEEYGVDRLKALLSTVSSADPGYKVAQRIVKATDEHTGPGRLPHDDRTLLILRVTDDTEADFSKLPIIY